MTAQLQAQIQAQMKTALDGTAERVAHDVAPTFERILLQQQGLTSEQDLRSFVDVIQGAMVAMGMPDTLLAAIPQIAPILLAFGAKYMRQEGKLLIETEGPERLA